MRIKLGLTRNRRLLYSLIYSRVYERGYSSLKPLRLCFFISSIAVINMTTIIIKYGSVSMSEAEAGSTGVVTSCRNTTDQPDDWTVYLLYGFE